MKTPKKTVVVRISEKARKQIKSKAGAKGMTIIQYIDFLVCRS